MIFISFVLYKNISKTQNWIYELKKIIWENLDIDYISELSLSEKRLETIASSNLLVFQKYKFILDNLFEIFSVSI